MKRNSPLWLISVTTSIEAEDAAAETLGDILGLPVTSYQDLETGILTLSVFSEHPPAHPRLLRKAIARRLTLIANSGLQVGQATITLKRLPRKNWAEAWKKHFKPLRIGGALLLRPSWSKARPNRGEAVIVLDPGLSFGTGQHPTTGFCLREIARHRNLASPKSFLDVGTGSGILAIAAAKLGYRPAAAFDYDPESVRIARANAARNRAAAAIQITRRDVRQMPLAARACYDFICANLLGNLLIAEAPRIVSCLKPAGTLVLAGILEAEFIEVCKAYESAGCRLVRASTTREWRSGIFRKR